MKDPMRLGMGGSRCFLQKVSKFSVRDPTGWALLFFFCRTARYRSFYICDGTFILREVAYRPVIGKCIWCMDISRFLYGERFVYVKQSFRIFNNNLIECSQKLEKQM